MRTKNLFFLLAFFISVIGSFAQQPTADSLLQESLLTPAPPDRIDLLTEYARDLYRKDAPAGLQLANEAIAIAENHKLKLLLAKAQIAKGMNLLSLGRYDTAIAVVESAVEAIRREGNEKELAGALNILGSLNSGIGSFENAEKRYKEALKLYEQLQEDSEIANTYGNLSRIYFYQNKLEEALELLLKALSIYEQQQDDSGIAFITGTIASVYQQQEDFENAIKYRTIALKKKEAINDAYGIALNLNNLGMLYNVTEDFDKAIANFEASLKIKRQIGDVESLPITYIGLAGALEKAGYIEKALEYSERALHLVDSTGNTSQKAAILTNCCSILSSLKRYQKAIDYCKGANEIAQQTNDLQVLMYSWEYLRDLYYQTGQYQASYEANEAFLEAKDSVFNADRNQQLAEMQSKYEADKKQQQNQHLLSLNESISERNRWYLIAATGLLLLLIVVSILYLQLQKTKRSLAGLNQTKDRFFGIIAHDLRGPIVSFQGLGRQLQSYSENAQIDKLNELGGRIYKSGSQLNTLLDNLLHWSMVQTDTLSYNPKAIQVADAIEEAVELLEQPFAYKQISPEFHLTEQLFVWADEQALQAILRNLLSNAIKFTPEAGEITITTASAINQVCIKIEDKGVGITSEQLDSLFQLNQTSQTGTKGEKGSGLGLLLCKELLDINNGRILIASSPGAGTEVSVYLPKTDEHGEH
jgi:signal transduction histidine kinase